MTKKNPFKTVSKNLPFWPDAEKPEVKTFIGGYVSSTILGDDPDPAKNVPAYIFADVETGQEYFILQSYAIKKAVDLAMNEHKTLNDLVFRFDFIEKTVNKSNKPFNKIDTGYCTLEEYEMSKTEESEAAPARGKKK